MHLSQLVITLKHRREVPGVTHEQLADLSGVGLRTLKALESKKSNPTLETLTKLADVLGMELKLVVKQAEF